MAPKRARFGLCGFDLRDFMRPKGGQSANSPANTSRSRHRRTVGLPNRRSSAATRRTSGWNPLSGLPCPPSVAHLTFDAGYAVKKKGGASYPAPKFGTISGLVQRVRTQTISQARPDTKTLTSNRYLSCPRVSHTTRASHPRGSARVLTLIFIAITSMPCGSAWRAGTQHLASNFAIAKREHPCEGLRLAGAQEG